MAQVLKNRRKSYITYRSYIQSLSHRVIYIPTDPVLLDLIVFTYLNYEGPHTVKLRNIKEALKGYLFHTSTQ